MINYQFSFSVVSHNQIDLVRKLIVSIEEHVKQYEIILTNNTKQDVSEFFQVKNIRIIQNETSKGFGENHNYAFKKSSGECFVVINPDIIISKWSSSIEIKRGTIYTGLIFNPNGSRSDNVRGYPSIPNMILRYLKYNKRHLSIWFAGMFLIFHRDDYKTLNGFDERFYMYLEDTDLCMRARIAGVDLIEFRNIKMFHDSRRYSKKKIKYLLIHLSSLIKFYLKHPKVIFSLNP